jgi:hypothetical protein
VLSSGPGGVTLGPCETPIVVFNVSFSVSKSEVVAVRYVLDLFVRL